MHARKCQHARDLLFALVSNSSIACVQISVSYVQPSVFGIVVHVFGRVRVRCLEISSCEFAFIIAFLCK